MSRCTSKVMPRYGVVVRRLVIAICCLLQAITVLGQEAPSDVLEDVERRRWRNALFLVSEEYHDNSHDTVTLAVFRDDQEYRLTRWNVRLGRAEIYQDVGRIGNRVWYASGNSVWHGEHGVGGYVNAAVESLRFQMSYLLESGVQYMRADSTVKRIDALSDDAMRIRLESRKFGRTLVAMSRIDGGWRATGMVSEGGNEIAQLDGYAWAFARPILFNGVCLSGKMVEFTPRGEEVRRVLIVEAKRVSSTFAREWCRMPNSSAGLRFWGLHGDLVNRRVDVDANNEELLDGGDSWGVVRAEPRMSTSQTVKSEERAAILRWIGWIVIGLWVLVVSSGFLRGRLSGIGQRRVAPTR